MQTSSGRKGRYDVRRLHRRSFTISRGSQWRRFSIYYQFSGGFGRAISMHHYAFPCLNYRRFSFPVGLALPPFYLPLSSITRGDRKIFIFVDLRVFSTLSETKTLRDSSCLDVTINWKILNCVVIFKTSFLWNNFKNFKDRNDFYYYLFNNLSFAKRPIKIYISYFARERKNFHYCMLFQKLLFMLEI